MPRQAKLTLADVKAARRSVAAGSSISAVARDLGVHHETVAKAVYGQSWARVTKPAPLPRPQVPARARVNGRLTADDVAAARRRYLAGEKKVAIAASFGVGTDTIRDAIHGQTWATVADPPPVPKVPTKLYRQQAAAAARCALRTWDYRVSHGHAPQPDHWDGRRPWWWDTTIMGWIVQGGMAGKKHRTRAGWVKGKSRPEAQQRHRAAVDALAQSLGHRDLATLLAHNTLPDVEVATKLGISTSRMRRWRRTMGQPSGWQPGPIACKVPNCGSDTSAHGYCPRHYYRWRRYGDPLAGKYEQRQQLLWRRPSRRA